MDNLLGHFMDSETKKLYSFSELFSQDEIEEIYY